MNPQKSEAESSKSVPKIITKSNRTRGPSKPNKEKKTKKSKKTKEMLVVPFNFEEFVKAETKKLRDEELYYTKEYHNQTYAKKVSDHFTKELNSMNNEELVKEFTTLFPYCSDHEEDKRLTSLKEQIDILGIKVSGDELKVIEMLFITPPDEIFVCANKEFVIDEKLVKERYDIRNENVIKLLSVDGWLNDEVINAYILLLKARNHEGRNYHFVSSFYYEKVKNLEWDQLSRWNPKPLKTFDKVFMPIHLENHWALMVVNKEDQRLEYFDSITMREEDETYKKIIKSVCEYYEMEAENVEQWQKMIIHDIPKQQNSYDCGMFMLKYIRLLSEGKVLDFCQDDVMAKFSNLAILNYTANQSASVNTPSWFGCQSYYA